jgi:hypothetical protein
VQRMDKQTIDKLREDLKILLARHPLDPGDSPVTVRGGSVEILSPSNGNSWQSGNTASCLNPNVKSSQYLPKTDTSLVALSGIEATVGGKPTSGPESVSVSGISSNWSITLGFRKSDYTADNTFEIQLSSYDPCKAIPAGGPGSDLYLADIGTTSGTFDLDDPIDGFIRYRYDVSQCDDGSKDPKQSKCNHFGQISVSGLTGNGQTISGPFLCRAFACDIGIGKPL